MFFEILQMPSSFQNSSNAPFSIFLLVLSSASISSLSLGYCCGPLLHSLLCVSLISFFFFLLSFPASLLVILSLLSSSASSCFLMQFFFWICLLLPFSFLSILCYVPSLLPWLLPLTSLFINGYISFFSFFFFFFFFYVLFLLHSLLLFSIFFPVVVVIRCLHLLCLLLSSLFSYVARCAIVVMASSAQLPYNLCVCPCLHVRPFLSFFRFHRCRSSISVRRCRCRLSLSGLVCRLRLCVRFSISVFGSDAIQPIVLATLAVCLGFPTATAPSGRQLLSIWLVRPLLRLLFRWCPVVGPAISVVRHIRLSLSDLAVASSPPL